MPARTERKNRGGRGPSREQATRLIWSHPCLNRRKGTPYQSAMSMLNFYINRAGKNLPESRKRVLERAKAELREIFGRA
jgi:Protein of unknown function (DUF3175)